MQSRIVMAVQLGDRLNEFALLAGADPSRGADVVHGVARCVELPALVAAG